LDFRKTQTDQKKCKHKQIRKSVKWRKTTEELAHPKHKYSSLRLNRKHRSSSGQL